MYYLPDTEPVRYDISYYLPDTEPVRYDISYYLPDIEPVRYDISYYLPDIEHAGYDQLQLKHQRNPEMISSSHSHFCTFPVSIHKGP